MQELALLVAIAAVLFYGLRKFPTILWSKKDRKRRDEVIAAYDEKIRSDREWQDTLERIKSSNVETYEPQPGSLLDRFLKSLDARADAGLAWERRLVQTVLPDKTTTYREMPSLFCGYDYTPYINSSINGPEVKPVTGEIWRAPKPIKTGKGMEVFLTFVDGTKGYLVRRKKDGAGLWCSVSVLRNTDIFKAAIYLWAMQESPAIQAIREIGKVKRLTLATDASYWKKQSKFKETAEVNQRCLVLCRDGLARRIHEEGYENVLFEAPSAGEWLIAINSDDPDRTCANLDLGANQAKVARQIREVCKAHGLTPA